MQNSRDIYTKTSKGNSGDGYEPMQPPDIKRTNRRAVVIFVLMALSLTAAVILLGPDEEEEDIDYEELLSETAIATNMVVEKNARSEISVPSFANLLTDIGISGQSASPSLSPQKMAEAMSYIRSSQEYIRASDMLSAEREIMRALEVWPEMNIAIRLLGSIYTQRGQFDQAIVLLEKSLSKEPFSAEVLNNLAINYMQKGMMAKAEELLMTSLQIRQNYPVAFVNLGFVHLRTGRYDLAAENFEQGLKEMPNTPGVLNNLAVCLIRLGDYEAARERLNELMELAPSRATSYFNMAITYVLEQDYDVALDWIRRGADYCSPSQLQSYMSDSDFDALRPHPDFQQIIKDRFPDIPVLPPLS